MKLRSATLRILAVMTFICVFGLPGTGRADTFSVLNDASLFDSPLDGTNSVALYPADLGLSSSAELNALSFGYDSTNPYDVYFSVDAASQGVAGTDVKTRALTNRQMGSVFDSNPGQLAGVNFTDVWGVDYGLTEVSGGSNNDNVDALDLDAAPYTPGVDGDVYFSDGSGNIYLNNLSTLYLSNAQLGLGGEVIDALAVDPGQGILFSIAASNGTYSAADLIFSDGTGTNSLAVSAADLGLLSTDNLNALSTTAMVPEPSSLVFLATGLLGLFGLRRRVSSGKGGRHV